MRQYRMSFLDKFNFSVTARDFSGPDDAAAIAHALTLCRTHTIGINHGDRNVARILKGTRHHVLVGLSPEPSVALAGMTPRRRAQERNR